MAVLDVGERIAGLLGAAGGADERLNDPGQIVVREHRIIGRQFLFPIEHRMAIGNHRRWRPIGS